jgi:hypothetical protein
MRDLQPPFCMAEKMAIELERGKILFSKMPKYLSVGCFKTVKILDFY